VPEFVKKWGGQYKKRQAKVKKKWIWEIVSFSGHVVATTTEDEAADVLLAHFLGHARSMWGDKAYAADVYHRVSSDTEDTPYYCADCEHKAPLEEFIPSDSTPAPLVCPECSRVNIFIDDPVGDEEGDAT
jgi:hypothetical protein